MYELGICAEGLEVPKQGQSCGLTGGEGGP